MRQRLTSLEDLLDVLASGREHEHLEFKEAKASFSIQKLIEYCVALANERGGHIVFGVTDRAPRQVVGTRAFENVETVKKQVFDALRFRIEVTEFQHSDGRVLVIYVPSRPIGTPIHYDGRYLARVGESLVPMSPDHLQSIFSESQQSQQHLAGGYLCGSRIRRVREDLRLKPSHVVDLTQFSSEAAWRLAETNRAEVSSEHLAAFANLTGANADWLKHGDGVPYDLTTVNDFSWTEDLSPLIGVDPFTARVVIDPRSMRWAVVQRTSDHRTSTYLFTFDLAFWQWADDHHHIPAIWRCMKWLHEDLGILDGAILESKHAERIFSGEAHAGGCFDAPRSHWFDDVFDLNRDIGHLRREYEAYGRWFAQLQAALKTWGSRTSG